MSFSVEFEIASNSKTTFTFFLDELSLALHRLGLEFEPEAGASVRQDSSEVARVISWIPGKRVSLQWHAVDWEEDPRTKIDFEFRATKRGTRIIMRSDGFERVVGGKGELLGWLTDQVVAPVLSSSTPSRLGDWITDRRARRPTGANARKTYRNPTYHRPNFGAILSTLALSADDYLLEIGCGGGAFLNDSLRSGCRAQAVDHSAEMVRLAKRVNSSAIREGRLEIREAEADLLPFEDSTFTCAVMTSVLGFLPDATKVFAEVFRVLRPGGRMVVFSTTKEAKGTPAAPEPIASRIHFYEDHELQSMALKVGFNSARVEHPDLSRFVSGSGIPKRDESLFSSRSDQLLVADKR